MEHIDICLAPLRFPPDYSGPGIRFKRYEPGLRQRGIRLRVVALDVPPDADGAPDADNEHSPSTWNPFRLEQEEVDGIPVVRMPSFEWNRRLRSFLYGCNVARYCRQRPPDVLHSLAATPWNSPALAAVRAAKIPIIYTQTMVSSRNLPRVKERFNNLAYKPLSCVVVSSSVMRRRLQARGVTTRIEVIPNGVDLQRFRPAATEEETESIRRKLSIPPEQKIILFVGGALVPRKGVDLLARAWARLAKQRPNLGLILLGKEKLSQAPQQTEFLRDLKAMLRPFENKGRVQYPGMVNNVEEYMKASDVFVFPSRREGMPNVVAEAFACALPSILTLFEGLPEEFGQPGREYLLVDRDETELTNAIATFLESSTKRSNFGRRARTWVEDNLSVENSLDQYAALYRELANR